MSEQAHRAVAVVGIGAILPDAPDVATFWQNLQQGRYSITEVPHERWDPADYYDPDPNAVDKSYCKIGAWVREYAFEPLKWRLPIPPAVQEAMDGAQKWAIAASRQALVDYGWPERPLDTMRTAVVLGNAMAGEYHYRTSLRIHYPEYAHALEAVPAFRELDPTLQQVLVAGMGQQIRTRLPGITEDTMPGELSNIIAGRVANLLDLHGLNFVTDAACASSLAALDAAVEGLLAGHFDAVLTGGIDRNMDANSFVKFSKIGALSPDGSRPYAEGANGFVMGEGAAVFLLKRLDDAERDGDRIYAVIRGIGGASDGRGKGITAPNPIGPQQAIERAWLRAGLSPATVSYIEGHGTSTRVGDLVEVEAMGHVFARFDLRPGSISLGSVKSNIGHLKGAAGAAGLLKAVLALYHRALLPHANFERPNSNIDFDRLPFRVQTKLAPWEVSGNGDGVRRAGLSSFGFGGTNFHVVLEEHVPGMLTSKRVFASTSQASASPKTPYRGALLLGADDVSGLRTQLEAVLAQAEAGRTPPLQPPDTAALAAPERLAIDYGDADELLKRGGKALDALNGGDSAVWRPLSAQGIFRGSGPPGKVAFMFPGQGSQYVNMMRELCELDPLVADTFREADEVMTPLLGRPLTSYIFVDDDDKDAIDAAEEKLKDTTITQPAVLTVNVALARLLESYGVVPDMVIGHSLGEYAALVASSVLSLADALLVVSARGREMSKVSMDDNGCMAAVFAPLPQVEEVLDGIDGYVVLANINSPTQVVIGGATAAVDAAIAAFQQADHRAVKIPVSHAFHTRIVAPASEPLKAVISRMDIRPPRIPIIANVTGAHYPEAPSEIIDILGQQVASPVQFVKGIETLYREGARVYVEVGPKRVLKALSEDILGQADDTAILFTNHPRKGTLPSLNEALCGLYAAGVGASSTKKSVAPPPAPVGGTPLQPPSEQKTANTATPAAQIPALTPTQTGQASPTMKIEQSEAHVPEPTFTQPPAAQSQGGRPGTPPQDQAASGDDRYVALGRLFAEFLEQGQRIYQGIAPGQAGTGQVVATAGKLPVTGSVVVSGAALGLPGQDGKVFDDGNIGRLLRGEQFIELIPYRHRTAMAEKRINRLVKSPSGAAFEVIDDPSDTIKLAGRRGYFDLAGEYGVPESRVEALDISTQLAIAAGIEALRDAGIPLVMRYRTTSKGTYLPDRWMLPEGLADETGVIFASAFPGLDRMAEEMTRYHEFKSLSERLQLLQQLRARAVPGPDGLAADLDRRIARAQDEIDRLDYHFDRRFIFRVLPMGHSQFAEYIGARGPNTHVNAACATTTHAMAVAEDWIRAGRCRRVIVVAGDDVTSDNLMGWIGSGLLATGAATTEERLDKAALPFDRRRHGMIIGMGAAAIVVEAEDAVRERGMRGICELLSSQIANSAYHGTRLDVDHISSIMDRVVGQAEERFGIRRSEIAAQTVFVSHETYTPARGGSAAAEIHALRHTFGDQADQVVIANTKGYTGHAMGVGIEDILAVKALEHQVVPAVANIHNDFQPDQELGDLNLSRGGSYPVQYALRLGAGFGSQIALTLMRRIPGELNRVDDQGEYDRWVAAVAGQESAQLEIENRTLRIADEGPPTRPPALSTWAYGHGPTAWAITPGAERGAAPVSRPVVAPRPIAAPAPVPQASSAVSAPPPPAVAPPVSIPTPTSRPVETPAPAAPVATPTGETVADQVLALVSEKTGYPSDMLDLDLDLEADLGIDTVKQAEVFSTIRERYDIPRREGLQLRDYNTLAKVIQFVHDNRTDAAPVPAVATAPASRPVEAPTPAAPATVPPAGTVADQVLALVSEKTGYPSDMLDLDLDLEADLGIDTVKQAEVFSTIRERYDIPRREELQLRDYNTLAKVIQFVHDNRTDAAPAPAAAMAPASSRVEAPAQAEKAPAASAGTVADQVLALVSEKTGYPPDMLDLDLDLEADLGIDTVKQAEVFSTIRERYDIPRREELQLRDYNTLAKVIQFVHDNRTDQPQSTTQAPTPAVPAAEALPAAETVPAAAAGPAAVRVLDPTAGLEAANALPRRVPVPVLRPALDRCKPTGVEYGDEGRIIVVSDEGKVGHYMGYRLRARKAKALALKEATPGTVTSQLEEWLAEGPVDGVYFLPALDVEPPLSEMDLPRWRTEQEKRVKALYTLMRALPEEAFLISATRLGGLHGYGGEGATAPLGGAVTGFTKTYARERPGALVKALDFSVDADDRAIAEILVEETLRDPGAVEIGYRDGQRYTIVLEERPVIGAKAEIELNGETVFLITGAAGGITSSIVADLARASAGTFYLTDIAPPPDPEDPDLGRLEDDERKYLKRDIAQRIKDAGERPTPVMVDRQIAILERAASVLSAMREIERVGGTVHYRACDVTDAGAVHELVREIAETHGRVDVLVHAAGLERSHSLPDKDPREFNLIFDVKADGLFNLLKATEAFDCPLRASVVFSSIAGRFGNAGQTDYSAANDLMCKVTSSMRATRPGAKAIAIDWSAWGKVGMATRGSIPEMMRRAGIDMLDPEAAVPVVRREIISSGTGGEVLIAGSLGILLDPRDPDGGLDVERANEALAHAYPVAGRLIGVGSDGSYTFEAALDPKAQPFLHDHAMDETPLLPGVMGVEGFAEVATLIATLGTAGPAPQVVSIEDVQFQAPLKFYRGEPRAMTWHARVVPEGAGLLAEVALESSRALKGGNVQQTRHFSGRVHLVPQTEGDRKRPSAEPPRWNGAETLLPQAVYRVYFHGPAFQVLDGVQSDGTRIVGRYSDHLPPMADREVQTLVAPLLIELCLQTAGVWEIGKTGVLALPSAIERVRVYGLPANGRQLYAEIAPRQGAADELAFDARVIDENGVVYLELEGYRTARLPAPLPQDDAAPLQALVGGST